MCHDSFLCAMTIWIGHLFMWKVRDLFICAMTHLYVPWLKSLLYWKHTSAVYFTQKSILLRKCLSSLLYSEVYFTENINQQSTLLKIYLSSLLYWIHTSAVYSEVYFLRNTISGIFQKSLRWHFSRESLRIHISQKLRNISSEKCYLRDFWEKRQKWHFWEVYFMSHCT